MSTTTALMPLEQKTVDFYNDTVVAVLLPVENQPHPQIYVPVRPICEHLGLNWPSQYQRIKRDPVLSTEAKGVVVTTTPGGQQEAICLPIEFLHGWLFGISAARIKSELRTKVIRYQHECYRVLWQAFQADTLTALGITPSTSVLSQVRDMGMAIVQMAEQQIMFEGRLASNESRLDRAAQVVGELGRRLSVVEERVQPQAVISEAQAAEVSQAVKALATLLTPQDRTRNQYQAVFGELYRQFGVSSYKNITTRQFQAVLDFLEEWRKTASSSS